MKEQHNPTPSGKNSNSPEKIEKVPEVISTYTFSKDESLQKERELKIPKGYFWMAKKVEYSDGTSQVNLFSNNFLPNYFVLLGDGTFSGDIMIKQCLEWAQNNLKNGTDEFGNKMDQGTLQENLENAQKVCDAWKSFKTERKDLLEQLVAYTKELYDARGKAFVVGKSIETILASDLYKEFIRISEDKEKRDLTNEAFLYFANKGIPLSYVSS